MTGRGDSQDFRVPDELARQYLAHNAELRLAANTVQTYDSHLTAFAHFLHDREKAVMTAEYTDVLEFVEVCVRRGNRASTIKGKLSTIRELYCYIKLRTDAGADLCLDPLRFQDIDVDSYRLPEPLEREALSREEIRLLFDAFDSYRNRLMAVVAVETGLRNSDLRTLRISDVDFADLEIHVSDPKNSRPYDVPIGDELAFELDHWVRCHRGAYASASESKYLFPSSSGSHLTQNGAFSSIVKEAAERAGIQETIGESTITVVSDAYEGAESESRTWHRVTPHTLRHSFITLLNDAGIGLSHRQLVANHAHAETTNAYTHSSESSFDHIREQFDPPR